MILRVQEFERLLRNLQDPIYRNSLYLIASSFLGAGSGFVFWIIAARLYSPSEVGMATAIISAGSLLSMLSLLGLDIGVIKYMHEKDRNYIINSCLTTAILSSVLITLLFLAIIDLLSPALRILKHLEYLLIFILFVILDSLTFLLRQGIFVGLRDTKNSFLQTLAAFPRIVILPFLVPLGALGIFASFSLTSFLAVIIGIILISKIYPFFRLKIKINKDIIRDMFYFSIGNHVARIFEHLPGFVLPILVVNTLGAKMNAYFYIPWTISILLLAIPRFTSMSLFAEGSYAPEHLRRNALQSIKFIFMLLIPIICIILLFGKQILFIFGKKYAKNSIDILRLLTIAVIPFSFNSLYAAIKRVQKDVKSIIYIYGNIAIVTLIGSYFLIQKFKLIGIGYSWILGNLVTFMGISLKLIYRRMSNRHIIIML